MSLRPLQCHRKQQCGMKSKLPLSLFMHLQFCLSIILQKSIDLIQQLVNFTNSSPDTNQKVWIIVIYPHNSNLPPSDCNIHLFLFSNAGQNSLIQLVLSRQLCRDARSGENEVCLPYPCTTYFLWLRTTHNSRDLTFRLRRRSKKRDHWQCHHDFRRMFWISHCRPKDFCSSEQRTRSLYLCGPLSSEFARKCWARWWYAV